MSENWIEKRDAERRAKAKRNDLITKILAGLIVFAMIVAIVGVVLGVRRYAPCWVFPLAEAPTRCLPGAVQP